MKCEIERMEKIRFIFVVLRKVIKKLLTFCYWIKTTIQCFIYTVVRFIVI